MNQDDGYILARVLSALFKKRPFLAYAIFDSILVIVLCVFLIRAKTPDERVFPILGLAFVLIAMMVQFVQLTGRERALNLQMKDKETDQGDKEPPTAQTATLQPDVQSQTQNKPQGEPRYRQMRIVNPLLLGAVAAGLLFANSFCISLFSIPVTSDAAQLVRYFIGILIPIASAIAASLGALGSLAVVWVIKCRRTQASLVIPAILTGAGIGLVLGIAAGRLMANFIARIP